MSEPTNLRCTLCGDALCASEAEFFPYCVPCASENPEACLVVALGASAEWQMDELERMAEARAERPGRGISFPGGLCDPADLEEEDAQGN